MGWGAVGVNEGVVLTSEADTGVDRGDVQAVLARLLRQAQGRGVPLGARLHGVEKGEKEPLRERGQGGDAGLGWSDAPTS